MKVVHFGAGNIGRGFIGKVLHDSGFQITFVDTNQSLIKQINQTNSYKISYVEYPDKIEVVNQVSALDAGDVEKIVHEIQAADFVTTSVGAENLKYIVPTLKRALLVRTNSLPILANENMLYGSDYLSNQLKEMCSEAEWSQIKPVACFVNTAIDRLSMSTKINEEEVALVEEYFEWVIEKKRCFEPLSSLIKGATFVDDLKPFIERKLFLVNAEHAALAYLGQLFGYDTIQEAAQDTAIVRLLNDLLTNTAKYFEIKYGMDASELRHYIAKTFQRHTHPHLHDEVRRVGRNPIRKLSSGERLAGVAKQMEKLGLPSRASEKVIASALFYRDSTDQEAKQLEHEIHTKGAALFLKETTDLSDQMIQRIAILYKEMLLDTQAILKE